jgi:hypothetical protein
LASLNRAALELMAKKPLRSQLNQIRAWVREGRTDAWIAHQLDIPASELREFRRRHELSPAGEDDAEAEADLRDEIEAEIEAAALEEAEEDEEPEEEREQQEEQDRGLAEDRPRRRRRRRRRRSAGRQQSSLQATFDHGDTDGFGLWLDPAIQDEPTYTEHWAGHRAVEVEIEPDRIVIKRSES